MMKNYAFCGCTSTGSSLPAKPVQTQDTFVSDAKFTSDTEVTITRNDGKTFTLDFTKFVPDGVADTMTFENNTLTITRTKGKPLSQDLSSLSTPDTYVTGGEVKNTTLHLTRNNGLPDVEVSLANFVPDGVVTDGTLNENNELVLNRSKGSDVTVDLSGLKTKNTYVISGEVTGNNLVLKHNDTDTDDVTIDISDLRKGVADVVKEATKEVAQNVLHLHYDINNQSGDYALTDDDYSGWTIIRSTSENNQTFTITKPSSEVVGHAVVIRRAAGAVDTMLNLVAGSGVTLSPRDVTPLRRIGSSATLVYTGNGAFDVFGELP